MIAAPPRTIMEIFESLPEGTLCELINNRIVKPPSPSYEHQDLSGSIYVKLYSFVAAQNLGKVLSAPLDIYLGRENVFQPDILFISTGRLGIIQGGKIKGAPDLIIEILSPGSESYDRNEKRDVYQKFGVQEYWLVDPQSKEAQGYVMRSGMFEALPVLTGQIQSPLLGTTIIL